MFHVIDPFLTATPPANVIAVLISGISKWRGVRKESTRCNGHSVLVHTLPDMFLRSFFIKPIIERFSEGENVAED